MAVRPPGVGLPHRPRLLTPVVAVVAMILVLGGVVVALYTDLLWFQEVGYSNVFSTVLRTKALLFAMFGLVMALVVGTNMAIAYRMRPPFRPMSLEQQNLERYRLAVEPYLLPSLLLASGVFGVFAGLSAASRWQTWLLWRNGTSFGQEDGQFGRDISYFAFTYPFQRFALGFLLTVLVLSLLVAAGTHYLFGGVRLQSVGEKVSPAARAHLSVLIGLIVLLKAYAYYLDRFGLAFSERGVVQGASYTDINAVLPAKNILVAIAIICSLLFFANIVVRNILLPAGALGLLIISAVVLGGVYPAYTQQFRVKPNEVQREAPYIERNIVATRAAYGIDKVVIEPYTARQTATAAQLRQDQGTVPNARLLDPNVLAKTFEQLQRIRSYFGVNSSLDIDRYTIDGKVQDYVVAAREVDQGGLRDDQLNWINQRLIYTHGNGFIAAAANQVNEEGQPVFAVGDVPPAGLNGGPLPIPIAQPRIYYGELSPTYSVVNTDQGEIDGPAAGDKQQTVNYDGDGGVQLSGIGRKLAYAFKFREKNLLLSGAIKSDSRLMYIREPRDRVAKVAPFLQLDSDPYPAVVDGKILWIVDGYTTSAGYPYSEQTFLDDLTEDSQTQGAGVQPQQRVNYIRNSVKATVDAFTGDVQLYTWDEADPVLQTWSKAFGGVLKKRTDISAELEAHLRYPEDLFKVQRKLLAQYHVQDSEAFYNKEDFWEVPADPAEAVNTAANRAEGQQGAAPTALAVAGASGPAQPPYYSLLQFPGQAKPRFTLSTSFVARGRPNLSAFASVSSDPEDYGTIRVLQLPRNSAVAGPGQAANQLLTAPEVAESLLALRRNGTKITFGNLLTLPVGGGLLYVQPVFVSAQGGESFPTLQRVIVNFGSRTASEPTLKEALTSLFGAGAAEPSAPPRRPGATPPPTSDTLAALVAEADAAFKAGQEALRRGDFAAYGAAQERLRIALDRLAERSGARTSPSPSPSPTTR